MALSPGARFGHFTIEALLGEGGMGQVYRAFDARLERRVALKILHAVPSNDGTLALRPQTPAGTPGVAAILREARAAAALDHPHAVSIFEVGEEDGIPFLAMELCIGTSLRALIGYASPGTTPPTIAQRLRWLGDIARALDAAHAAGIVHLDIKPDNVIVRADGVVKVLDFGIARRTDLAPPSSGPAGAAAIRTASVSASAFAGTPAYMAPEQVRGRKVDGRTDQFAWGVVAFELLTGRKPWPADQGVEALLSAIALSPAPRLHGMDRAVERVVRRALEKAPGDRYPTMAEAAAALDDAAGAVPVAVPPVPDLSAFPPEAPTETIPQLVRVIATDAASPSEGLAPTPPAQAPRRSRGILRLSAAALCVAVPTLALGWAAFSPLRPPPALASRASLGSFEEAAATTLETLPPPQGCKDSALPEYAAGVHALHEGAWERARARFQRAVDADPECAAAEMRLVMTSHRGAPIATVREAYTRAQDRRATLSERDRILLDAYEPLVRRDRGDERASGARFATASERLPDDAELALLAAQYTMGSDPDAALASARRAATLDPSYPDAWETVGDVLHKQGRTDEALEALDRCQRVAPSGVDCVRERVATLSGAGRCVEMEAAARQWIARDPETSSGYLALAQALASAGRPAEAVEEALRQRWSRLPAAERARREPYERALLAVVGGDFDGAERLARDLDRSVEGDASLDAHLPPAFLRVSILRETGRAPEAARLAADLLRRRAAWASRLSASNIDVPGHAFEPQILFAARHAEGRPGGAWEADRAAWMAESHAAASLTDDSIWSLGVAQFAETRAEAAEALAGMPPSLLKRARAAEPVPPYNSDAFAARALLLAGRAEEARGLARPLAASCIALERPFLHTEALLQLGQALEATGDRAGACAAFHAVLDRWAEAHPPSATATVARTRAGAMGCAR
jgi:serine/threonine-protein kinase